MKVVLYDDWGFFMVNKELFEKMVEYGHTDCIEYKNNDLENVIKELEQIDKDNVEYYIPSDRAEYEEAAINEFFKKTVKRNDPIFVKVVEENSDISDYLSLVIIEIPDDVKEFEVYYQDGHESIHEKHRFWTV